MINTCWCRWPLRPPGPGRRPRGVCRAQGQGDQERPVGHGLRPGEPSLTNLPYFRHSLVPRMFTCESCVYTQHSPCKSCTCQVGCGSDAMQPKSLRLTRAKFDLVQAFAVQSYVTGTGPYENWSHHVSDPFGYNLLSVSFHASGFISLPHRILVACV